MKPVLIILSVLILLSQADCAKAAERQPADNSYAAAIVGKWSEKAESSLASGGGVTEYRADGTAIMQSKISAMGREWQVVVKGFWKIVGNHLIMTATESSNPSIFPVGTVTDDEIVAITPTEMVLLEEDGHRGIDVGGDRRKTGC